MVELYKVFSNDWKNCLDYSNDSLFELYRYESYGEDKVQSNNGFNHGKKWLNLHVAMWKEDLQMGILSKQELYEDSKFPHWWLDSVLKDN